MTSHTEAEIAYAELRERAGQGETDAFTASAFPVGRAYDRVLPPTRFTTTQRVAVARAVARGLDPDAPMHLTRSVILSS
ncbi:hypothetical protein LDL08_27410 [Nonomuraea glycinis]|uniref:hypothetical protein n=1 Tax=Nonomuraea glycinis TaxID=2047744 RepID=UPI001CD9FA4A|nr:hypothetical protein [Nonomuraea glycinis]MCA2179913.1 hypothetical protein [Nonomuraea glycinis]